MLAALCATEPQPPDRVLRALDEWVEAYRIGNIDLLSKRDVRETSIAGSWGLLPDDLERSFTARDELESLLTRCVDLQSADAALGVLRVAAAVHEPRRPNARRFPLLVSVLADRALHRFSTHSAHGAILAAARGAVHGKAVDDRRAIQAAALRALGGYRQAVFRSAIELQLRADSGPVRAAAADGLMRTQSIRSLARLARAMGFENDDRALRSMAHALRVILRRHDGAIYPPHLAELEQAAAHAIGRGSWLTDLQLIRLLEERRTAIAVPVLIEVLERFADSPELIAKGTVSRRLQLAAHAALVSLTGLRHKATEAAKWRRWWSRDGADFVVVDEPVSAETSGLPHFFGIPVRGSRVLFAVDLSGSMEFELRSSNRLTIALREVIRVVQSLPPDTRFDVVTFADRAAVWRGKMVPADAAHKRELQGFVSTLEAQGATNTWAALARALPDVLWRRRHDRTAVTPPEIDEVFLLSDGIPTSGTVTDAQDILQLTDWANQLDAVRINTVYLADQLTARDEDGERNMGMRARDFMRQLAAVNGGTFSEQF